MQKFAQDSVGIKLSLYEKFANISVGKL